MIRHAGRTGITSSRGPRTWVYRCVYVRTLRSAFPPPAPAVLIGPQLELPLAPVELTTSTLAPTVGLSGAVWIKFGRDLLQLTRGLNFSLVPVFSVRCRVKNSPVEPFLVKSEV